MPTVQELEQALIAADKAGDKDSARALAAEIDRQTQATHIPASEFGGQGVLTPDEQSGMTMPTPEQLQARKDEAAATQSDIPYESMGGMPILQGAPLWARAGAGIKMTPEGKASFYQQTLGGQQPVVRGPGDKIYMYDAKTATYKPVNPSGLDLGDVADLSGAALQTAPNVIAATTGAGATPTGQAVAGGVGSVLRQGVSALLPGEDQMTPGQRATDVGVSAGMAGVTQGFFNGFAKLWNAARPTNIIRQRYVNALDTPQGQQGAALLSRMSQRRGKDFFLTVGEETQDPWLLGVQENVANSFKGKSAALQAFNTQAKQAFTEAHQIVDDLGATAKVDPAAFGDDIASRFKGAVDRMFNARRLQADADYAAFDKNATQVPFRNLMSAVQDAEKNFSALRGSIRKGLRAVSPAIKDGNDMMSVSALQDLRKVLSNAAYGRGRIFDRLDPGTDKMIARDLVKAIDADFGAATDWVGQDLKGALDRANTNWRNNTDVINGLRDTVIGRMLRGKRVAANGTVSGGADLTSGLLNAAPRDVAAILKVTEFDDPAFHAQLRNQFVHQFVQDGIKGASSLPPGTFPFNPKTAISGAQGVGGDRDLLKVLFNDPAQRQAYQDLLRFTQRIAQHQPTSSVGLKPTQEFQEAAAIAGGAVSGHPASVTIFGSRFLAKWHLGNTATKLIFDKEGQQTLRTLAVADPRSRAFANAATQLLARTAMEPSENDTAQRLPALGAGQQ